MPETDNFMVPPAPASDTDRLIRYLDSKYRERKNRIRTLMAETRALDDRTSAVKLGIECLLFRSELDEWIALGSKIYDNEYGDQLSIAHNSRDRSETKQPLEMLKAQANVHIAPMKGALSEMRDTQDLLNKTVSWCQTLQKTFSADEYAESFQHQNDIPDEFFDAESAAKDLAERRGRIA